MKIKNMYISLIGGGSLDVKYRKKQLIFGQQKTAASSNFLTENEVNDNFLNKTDITQLSLAISQSILILQSPKKEEKSAELVESRQKNRRKKYSRATKKNEEKRALDGDKNEALSNVESVQDQDMMVVLGQGHHIALACNLQAATAGHLQKLFRFLSDRFTY
jgi:hypothetical protein